MERKICLKKKKTKKTKKTQHLYTSRPNVSLQIQNAKPPDVCGFREKKPNHWCSAKVTRGKRNFSSLG